MAFSMNTNLPALQAYNALMKINAQTEKAQLRISTQKKINSVADDTSGFMVGKSLESQTAVQKSQLNNVASGKNYLSTAETALQQINDKLNEIASKYSDSQDPLKDKNSLAADIKTLAGEIDSILKNTNINGTQLLANSDGTTVAAPTFGVGGSPFIADFASASYLKAAALSAALGTNGVASVIGNTISTNTIVVPDKYVGTDTQSTVSIRYDDGTYETLSLAAFANGDDIKDIADDFRAKADALTNTVATIVTAGVDGVDQTSQITLTGANGKKITSVETIDGHDWATEFGLNVSAGLQSNSTNTVLTAASNISGISSNVKSALGRIGNLQQTLSSRSDYLTASISNNKALISSLFDADMVQEQLNSTQGQISSNIATTMLSQLNLAPQNLLSLFR